MKRIFQSHSLIILGFVLIESCSPKQNDNKKGETMEAETRFEIQPFMNEVSDTTQFSLGLSVTSEVESSAPAGMVFGVSENYQNLYVTQNDLIGSTGKDSKVHFSPISYVFSENSKSIAFHTSLNEYLNGYKERAKNYKGICKTQWGSIIVAPIYEMNKADKGFIYEWKEKGITFQPLTNLGKGNFTAIETNVDRDGTKAIYYSDQSRTNSFLYKFVIAADQSMDSGKLYVASFKHSYWILLDVRTNTLISPKFKTQKEVQNNLHDAAELAGATTMLPISDLKIDPTTKQLVFAVLPDANLRALFGGIYSFGEEDGKSNAVLFHFDQMVIGGEHSKFSHPQYIAFDKDGNLWIVNQLTAADIENPNYFTFSRNGLVLLPKRGPQTGLTFLIGVAGRNQMFSGIALSSDRKVLCLGVLDKNGPSGILKVEGALLDKLGN